MISPRAPPIGLPTFRLSSQASSSLCFLIRSANLASVRPRLPAAQFAQPFGSSNAFCAAATARSTSSRPPSGAVAMTLPVAGLTTSNVWPSAASTDSPPMIIRAVVGASVAAASGARWSVVIGSGPRAGIGRRVAAVRRPMVRPACPPGPTRAGPVAISALRPHPRRTSPRRPSPRRRSRRRCGGSPARRAGGPSGGG